MLDSGKFRRRSVDRLDGAPIRILDHQSDPGLGIRAIRRRGEREIEPRMQAVGRVSECGGHVGTFFCGDRVSDAAFTGEDLNPYPSIAAREGPAADATRRQVVDVMTDLHAPALDQPGQRHADSFHCRPGTTLLPGGRIA